jgi:branched-chain amino acid transport system substrate-binding protein
MKRIASDRARTHTAASAARPGRSPAAEQYVALPSYRVGPYAAGGSGFYGGIIDYFNLVNLSGGVNGVKISWEECETEYNPSRGVECYERLKTKNGGATLVEPLSTGVAYGVLDRLATDKIPMTMIGYGRSDAANGKVFPYVFPLITSYWNQAAAMIKYLGDKERRHGQTQGQEDRPPVPRFGLRQGTPAGAGSAVQTVRL